MVRYRLTSEHTAQLLRALLGNGRTALSSLCALFDRLGVLLGGLGKLLGALKLGGAPRGGALGCLGARKQGSDRIEGAIFGALAG